MNRFILLLGALSLFIGISSACVFENCLCDATEFLYIEDCPKGVGFPRRSPNDDTSQIETLDLDELGLESIPEDQLDGLSVSYLDLSKNQITELKANTFKGAKIMQLSIKDNQIRRIDPNTFKPLTTINELWLSGNELSRMSKLILILLDIN